MAVHLKIFLLIAVLSSAVYFNSFHNSFHFDDQHYIVANPYIRDLSNIPNFFKGTQFSSFEKAFAAHYRPLLVVSYALNYAVGGLNPTGYHIVNLLFHIGTAFLVFLIVKAMLAVCEQSGEQKSEARSKKQEVRSKKSEGNGNSVAENTIHYLIPLSTALIFAVHPFNSEVVNYITARSSVMCSFFYLLSFYCWIKFRSQQTEARSQQTEARSQQTEARSKKQEVRRNLTSNLLLLTSNFLPLTSNFYLLSLLAFLLAILTKEIAITLPVMLIIYDIYFVRDDAKHSSSGVSTFSLQPSAFSLLKCYLPFISLVAIPYLIFRSSMLKLAVAGRTSDLYINLLTQPKVLLKYLQLVFFPMGLTIDHVVKKSSTGYDSIFILSILAIMIILLSAYFLFKRGGGWRILSFFILWFFITLLPTTLVPLNAILQENRGYLAGIVFPVMAGIIFLKMPQRIAIALLIVLVFTYSINTAKTNAFWKDEFTLWQRAADISPSSPRAHDNLGLAYVGRGDYNNAIREFEYTLKLNPLYYLAYYNAGVVYQTQKRLDLAKASYEHCLKINPDFFRVYYNLGIVYKKTGELDKAITVYEKAISIDPRHPFVYNNLGIVLTEKGELDKAESIFKKAIEINPDYAKAYYNIGSLYYRKGKYDLAVESFNRAVEIEPDYKEARQMLTEAMKKRQ
ncbi:MAG: tetratricopeptide repeat protein [Nitrospirae bacterium]|nr:tetratricopeptide repeat protein [Nitrospirota bacterium]